MANKGLEYEVKIKNILKTRELLPESLLAKIKEYENDAGFIHKGMPHFLELKNITAPDYGSKKIVYDAARNTWKWNAPDDMSDLFDKFGVLHKIKKFVPNKHVKFDNLLTPIDKINDRKNFENTIKLDDTAGATLLHKYYAKKNCFYIQVEGKGFFHMLEDRANLGVPKFMPKVSLRLRAKTHSSDRIHNYSFRVVIVGNRRLIGNSLYDIENDTRFPPISST